MNQLEFRKFAFFFSLAFFLILLYFTFKMLQPFLMIIVFSIIMVTITYPIYNKFVKWFKNRKTLAAITCCLSLFIAVILPLFLLILILADQSITTYEVIRKKIESGQLDNLLNPANWGFLKKFIAENAPFIKIDEIDIKKEAVEILKKVSMEFVNQVASIIKNLGSFLANFFLMIFTMFFFYKDGDTILQKITHLSPLPESHEKQIFAKFKEASKSIFIGVFFTALLQGLMGGIGFAIVGVNPFLWAIFFAFASIIPVVGTAVIWIPAGLVFIISGDTGSGIFFMIWSLVFSITIENFIKPFLIKGKTNIHPLIIFFSILGGISFFGIAGIILGPLVVSILLLFIEIYEIHNKGRLDKLDIK